MTYFTGSVSATKYILVDGKEIARVKGTATFFTHRDHLGSSSVVTDGTGNVIQWNANHPYGEDWQVDPPATTNIDKHRFTGKETDTGSGLIYFGARYYDPAVGRFTTVDPVGDGENWYAYCRDNPINRIDIDGRIVETPWDVFNVVLDGGFLIYDLHEKDYLGASLDTVFLVYDCLATGVPVLPGGGGSIRAGMKGSTAVIGHFPEYVKLSEELGVHYFNIPEKIWNKMSAAERWAANEKFLNRAIAKGKDFILATPLRKVKPGSYLEKEIKYLLNHGYKISEDGSKLVKNLLKK